MHRNGAKRREPRPRVGVPRVILISVADLFRLEIVVLDRLADLVPDAVWICSAVICRKIEGLELTSNRLGRPCFSFLYFLEASRLVRFWDAVVAHVILSKPALRRGPILAVAESFTTTIIKLRQSSATKTTDGSEGSVSSHAVSQGTSTGFSSSFG